MNFLLAEFCSLSLHPEVCWGSQTKLGSMHAAGPSGSLVGGFRLQEKPSQRSWSSANPSHGSLTWLATARLP